MAYLSDSDDFQNSRLSGGGGGCRACQCGNRGVGGIAEWYERDERPVRPMIGEPPPRLVLETSPLFDPNRPPPLVRRMQRVLSQGLKPLTLSPPFRTPPQSEQPDLRLSPDFIRKMNEKWDQERRQREMFGPQPPPVPKLTLGDAIRRKMNEKLDSLMSDLRVPKSLRSRIRNAANDAIRRGATDLLDRALTEMGIGGNAHKAISSSVRAAIEQIRVR